MLQQLLLRASPAVLGSLLVSTVGSQQANQIQNELALGNITLDDVYNFITNLAASPAVTALKDKDNNIIPFPKTTEDKLPEKDPDEDPEIPPSGIGEALDLIEERKKKESQRSAFADTYKGQVMKSVFEYLKKAGYDVTDSILAVMESPFEDVENVLKNAEDYILKPNKIANLEEIKKQYTQDPVSDITSTDEKTDTVRQGEGQTTIEALKTKSLQGENVDQGSSSSSRENVLKTEEGFEVANKALGIDFFTKVLTKEIAPPKKKYEPILDVSDIGNTFDVFQEKRTGDFENHIFTSIPTFQEAQVATADALIKTLPQNGSILDLGGTEGGFINTITEERPDVSGFIVDPNVVAQKMFNEQQMPNAYYIREAFTTDSSQYGKYAFDVEDENETPIETNYFDFSIVDDNSLDAVTEKMTFQFIDKGRNNKIKLISEKLKPEGIALFEEKFFTSKDDPVWQANEAKKNEFKLNYYDQKDLTEKQKNILEGMDKHQVTSPEFEEILSKYFNNVVQYWDSGNFKGYVASDSADTITKFLNNLEDLNSEYSNVSTPKFVTDKIVEKRRGGPISLPQMNML